VQITTDRLELRVMELEDSLKLLVGVIQTMTKMLGDLSEVGKLQTNVLQSLADKLENPDDDPPWSRYKG
jgi:uncharacterized coiled-coil protein SlyX